MFILIILYICWCPVDRVLVPLNNYRPILLETINSTLYIDNSVEFPNFNLVVNNLPDGFCQYHPLENADCPIFKLGDIIKYTEGAGQSYKMRFAVDVKATLDQFNFFRFSAVCMAYTPVGWTLICFLFRKIAKYLYTFIENEEKIDVSKVPHRFSKTFYNGSINMDNQPLVP